MNKRIYLDSGSFTPPSKQAMQEIQKILNAQKENRISNPMSTHKEGVGARDILENARIQVARVLNVSSKTIVFSSGATESNNIALTGALTYHLNKGKTYKDLHIIISETEHSSLHRFVNAYKKLGVSVSHIRVNARGRVSKESLQEVLKKETVFVSIMYVNSEIGTVEKLRKLGLVIRTFQKQKETEILFHTDASQAGYYYPIQPTGLGVDALTLDSTKVAGPQGVGVLYIENNTPFIAPTGSTNTLWDIRPGTPPLALIGGFTVAFEYAVQNRKKHYEKVETLRAYLIELLAKHLPQTRIHTSGKPITDIKKRDVEHLSPHICNIYFHTINHEYLAAILNEKGFAVSTKTACTTLEQIDSYTLSALKTYGVPQEGIRIGLFPNIKKRDLTRFVVTLKQSLPLAQIKQYL